MKIEKVNHSTNQQSMEAQALAPRLAAGQPQLELAFSGSACRSRHPRQRRLSRANWWFQRMRQIVDRACDWQPASVPRPEQIWFSGSHRAALADSKSNEMTVVTT